MEEPALRPALRGNIEGFSPGGKLPSCAVPGQNLQLHVSEVNTESSHDRLSLESILAFQKVCQLVPPDVPMILESRVDEAEINEEIRSALGALNPVGQLAVAGD